MNRGYIRGHAERGDSSDGPIRFVAATEGVKRDGIDLRMQGAELDRFRANPVILFGHNAWGRQNLPIGRADNVGVEGDRLMMDISFDQEDEFARTVERKIRSGFLNAVSIGFDVRGWEKPGQNMWNGGVATKWELFETSVVPVPMDERATVESGRSARSLTIDAELWDFLRDHIDSEVRRAIEENQVRIEPEGISGVDANRVLASLKFGGEN